MILPGDPAPLFTQRANTDWHHYSFDMAAGRYSLLLFCPSLQIEATQKAINALSSLYSLKASGRLELFIISTNPLDEEKTLANKKEYFTIFDSNKQVHTQYGIAPNMLTWVVVDPMLRVKCVLEASEKYFNFIKNFLQNAKPFQEGPVPALLLEGVLEHSFCTTLIEYYNSQPSHISGVLTQNHERKAVNADNFSFKRRRDCALNDPSLVRNLQARIIRRVVPEIRKVFQCDVTGMDRMILSCYNAEERGCFGPHRDNTVPGAMHRLFAVSLNLNDGFEGGDLFFPEFSARGFCPPPGGAVIFSTALLHAVRPVTKGKRYACLPFVFNQASLEYAKQQERVTAPTNPL